MNGGTKLIPKIIHYCWCGPNDIPEEDKKRIERWKKICPDYKIMEWNESNYNFHKNRYMDEAYKKEKWGFVPDYARFDIIYQYGGIYLDTDVELIKKLDELLKNDAFFGFETTEFVASGLGFGAIPQNKIVGKMRDLYNDIDFIKKDGTLNLVSSPCYTTRVLKEFGFIMNGSMQCIEGCRIYPVDYFCPLNYISGELNITSNTYSIHWYAASWLSALAKKRRNMHWRLNAMAGKKLGIWLYRLYLIYSMIDNGELKRLWKAVYGFLVQNRK